jgi:hypothetical protein
MVDRFVGTILPAIADSAPKQVQTALSRGAKRKQSRTLLRRSRLRAIALPPCEE